MVFSLFKRRKEKEPRSDAQSSAKEEQESQNTEEPARHRESSSESLGAEERAQVSQSEPIKSDSPALEIKTERLPSESAIVEDPALVSEPNLKDEASSPDQLSSIKRGFFGRVKQMVGATDKSFAELKENIEEELLLADFGVAMTDKIISEWRDKASFVGDSGKMMQVLEQVLTETLNSVNQKLSLDISTKPFCLLIMGVNGSGKTTSLAKLANYYQNQGYKLHLAAGDTYRAAAVEQLQYWGKQLDINVTTGRKEREDRPLESAAVIYEGMKNAMADKSDIYLMDTAGRMPNNQELREQLQKVVKVVGKLRPGAPDEILLVLDASHGQSALSQAKLFCEAVPVSGILLTKLDGESKGGVIFSIAEEVKLPIRFIGVGEKPSDLLDFSAAAYVKELLSTSPDP